MSGRLLSLFFLAATALARGQVVQIGTPDPHFCEDLQVKPNLTVDRETQISGRVIDESGAPIQSSPVELRAFVTATKRKTLKTVTTDSRGYFNLGQVAPGQYRLIAYPTSVFQQPANLHCSASRCELSMALIPTPTDQPESQCPVR
jgi:hypothetical protein